VTDFKIVRFPVTAYEKLLHLRVSPFSQGSGESPAVTKQFDRWEDEDNEIVSVAKEIGQQLQYMIDSTKKDGPIKVFNQIKCDFILHGTIQCR
jgi:hypothetical protein